METCLLCIPAGDGVIWLRLIRSSLQSEFVFLTLSQSKYGICDEVSSSLSGVPSWTCEKRRRGN